MWLQYVFCKKKKTPYDVSRGCISKCKVFQRNHCTNHYIINSTVWLWGLYGANVCERVGVFIESVVCLCACRVGRIQGGFICLEKALDGFSLGPHKGVLEGPAACTCLSHQLAPAPTSWVLNEQNTDRHTNTRGEGKIRAPCVNYR